MDSLTAELSAEERSIVALVRDWVDDEVIPAAPALEREDIYPEALIEQMKELGVFGLLVPPPYGQLGVSMPCFALVAEELARGWMSLAGAMGSHSVVVTMLRRFGTPEQQERWLPRLATGEVRAAMALTEPSGGSDLQAMTTRVQRCGDRLVVNGTKTWISNAAHAGLIAVLAKSPDAEGDEEPMSVLLAEPGEGLGVSGPLKKLGYRGVEACELSFDDYALPASAVLGGEVGRGFAQMMSGLEVGRVQVAARATGVARAALDESLAYAQQRETFGRPIWQHQAVGHQLADSATELQAARLLLLHAARCVEQGRRADLEAGMAKTFASEMCMRVTTSALRVHGGYGYSVEYPVERYYRDAPLMVVGEGTNEIQRNVIIRQLVARGGV